MPATYKKINSVTVASTAAAIEFTSIPADYTDLLVYLSGRTTGTNSNGQGFCYLTFNGSSANFTSRRLIQDGISAASDLGGRFAGFIPNSVATTNTFGTLVLYLPNYTGNNNKSYSIDQGNENNSSPNYLQGLVAGLWSQTSAISSISFGSVIDSNGASASFAANSTATLYGILKA